MRALSTFEVRSIDLAAACRAGAMNRLWPVLLPELREFAAPEQDAAIQAARDTSLDLLELLGMAAGLVLVTAATRYGVAALGLAERFGAALASLFVALPLLALCLVPFHVRRLRRGLREQLQRRRGRP